MTFSTCGFHKSLQWHLRLYSWVQRLSSSRLSPLKWSFTCTALFLCVLSSALTLLLVISLGNSIDRFLCKLLGTWKTDGVCMITNKMFTVTEFLWYAGNLQFLKHEKLFKLLSLSVFTWRVETLLRAVSKSVIIMILCYFLISFFCMPKIRLKIFVERNFLLSTQHIFL